MNAWTPGLNPRRSMEPEYLVRVENPFQAISMVHFDALQVPSLPVVLYRFDGQTEHLCGEFGRNQRYFIWHRVVAPRQF